MHAPGPPPATTSSNTTGDAVALVILGVGAATLITYGVMASRRVDRAYQDQATRRQTNSRRGARDTISNPIGVSLTERRALSMLGAGYSFVRLSDRQTWRVVGGRDFTISNGVMSSLQRKGLVTFVGIVPRTHPAITPEGRAALHG